MKKIFYLVIVAFILFSCENDSEIDKDIVYQTGPFIDLLAGRFNGFVQYSELDKYGNFGIGTIDGLDGEGIEINAKKFTINWEGKAVKVTDTVTTPFAMKTFFDTDIKHKLKKELNYSELRNYLNEVLPDRNKLYAIKITGRFKYMKTRSMKRQEEPYLPLLEVLKSQIVFEFDDQKGTMAGFYIPESLNYINLTGYHFHFLTKNKNSGGHILELKTDKVLIEIDECKTIELLDL